MARYARIRGRTILISRETAASLKPILRWVVEASPRQREKSQASSILRKIEGISDWKQILLTRGEEDLLGFIRTEFPEGAATEEGRQLDLFTTRDFFTESHELIQNPWWKEKGMEEPLPKEKREITKFKKTLSAEEQAERDFTIQQSRYQPKSEQYWKGKLTGGN